MSDFLDGLERDLVDAMRRHEAVPRPLGLRLPRLAWRPLLGPAVIAAACIAALVVGVRAYDGADLGDSALPTENQAARLLVEGGYARAEGGFQLLVGGGRYQIVRCNRDDCAFDSFQGGARGTPKVRIGRVALRGDVAVFSGDATCRNGGAPLRGTYRVTSERGRVLFARIADGCKGRADVLERSAWDYAGR